MKVNYDKRNKSVQIDLRGANPRDAKAALADMVKKFVDEAIKAKAMSVGVSLNFSGLNDDDDGGF